MKARMLERLKNFAERHSSTARSLSTVRSASNGITLPPLDLWVLATVLGLGAALSGPYATFLTLGFWERLIYWQLIILVSFALWAALDWLTAALFGEQPFIIGRLVVIPPFAAVNSACILCVNGLMDLLGVTELRVDWGSLFLSHIPFSAFVVLPAIILTRTLRSDLESKTGLETTEFLTAKIAPALRGALPFALGAEGAYVRVYSDGGEQLITMRFEDALLAVSGIRGVQTHRSWWAATQCIQAVEPEGSAYIAILTSGHRIPISRRRKAEVMRELSKQTDGAFQP